MIESIRADLFARLSVQGGLPAEPTLYLYKQDQHGIDLVIVNALTRAVYEGTACAALPYVVDMRVKDVDWYVFVSPGLPQDWGKDHHSKTHVTVLLITQGEIDCEVWHVQPHVTGNRLDVMRYAGCDWCHPLETALVEGALTQKNADLVERWACTMHQRWSMVNVSPQLPPPYNPLIHDDVPGFQ